MIVLLSMIQITLTLHIRNDLNKKILAKTIFHELWHIIVVTNKKEIIKIGEEKNSHTSRRVLYFI